MSRAGLGNHWRCLFANDFDLKKARIYAQNWGTDALMAEDIKALSTADIPGVAHLAWGSFPCQDLSLAGGGAGLQGDRSGTFWPFWRLMTGLIAERRAPGLIVLENVCGALTSHAGQDFAAIGAAFHDAGYRFGALVADAALFVPQSRPRLFIVGARADLPLPDSLTASCPAAPWHTRALCVAQASLPAPVKASWLWWRLPLPSARQVRLIDQLEDRPPCVPWHTPAQTQRLLDMMSDINRQKVAQAQQEATKMVGCIYKRTRRDAFGRKAQRAEVRFDDLAGCLRTPAGGSSRQVLLIVDGADVRSRLISSRETARLMGLPDDYRLPDNYNEAYHLTGDGVVVPVVRHLAEHLFEPILDQAALSGARAAA